MEHGIAFILQDYIMSVVPFAFSGAEHRYSGAGKCVTVAKKMKV